MKKSQRGSIRRAPSAIGWVVSLTNMGAGSKTFDHAAVIKQWMHGFLLLNLLQCWLKFPVMTGLISGNIFLLVMNLHDKIINYIYLYIFTQGLIYIYIYLCIYIYIAQENLGYERFCASGIPLPPELTSLLVPRTCL